VSPGRARNWPCAPSVPPSGPRSCLPRGRVKRAIALSASQKQLEETIRDLVRLWYGERSSKATKRGTKTGSEERSTDWGPSPPFGT
jgi:hypothetical protein